MSASFLPSILVPLFALIIPLSILIYLLNYVDKDSIN